jgi:hypothetical protein
MEIVIPAAACLYNRSSTNASPLLNVFSESTWDIVAEIIVRLVGGQIRLGLVIHAHVREEGGTPCRFVAWANSRHVAVVLAFSSSYDWYTLVG